MKHIEFERQDLRRLWLVLGAVESMDRPSLANIAKQLRMQMSTLQKVIERINSVQLPETEISVNSGVYQVVSWGVVDKKAVLDFYTENACSTPGA